LLGSVAATEGTKAASLYAYIREVDIPVYDISDAIAHSASPDIIGNREQPTERVVLGAEKRRGAFHC
jgi:hypothetical protein